jgi:prophage antirepressor-like protein
LVLADVCQVLEIRSLALAAAGVDEEEERHTLPQTEGIEDARVQALTAVSEPGLPDREQLRPKRPLR